MLVLLSILSTASKNLRDFQMAVFNELSVAVITSSGGTYLSCGREYMRKVPNKDVAVHICHHKWLRFMMGRFVDGGIS